MTANEIAMALEAINGLIRAHAMGDVAAFKSNISQLGLKQTGKLGKSVKAFFRYKDGQIDRISYQAARYGFVLSNVGKNYTVDTSQAKYELAGFKQVGYSRIPVVAKAAGKTINERSPDLDWVWEQIDQSLPLLADKFAEANADLVVKASRVVSITKKGT